MKTYPIIFSAPMIRALLDGRKTQTRRLITNQWSNLKMHHDLGEQCLLWVRETSWLYENSSGQRAASYPADAPIGAKPLAKRSGEIIAEAPKRKTPSIHMPRWASRLTLEVSQVRIQRLQEITEADAIAEGATSKPKIAGWQNQNDGWSMDWPLSEPERDWGDVCLGSARFAFAAFINELHGGRLWNCKADPSLWDQNPEVAAITFAVHHQNVDDLIGQGKPA